MYLCVCLFILFLQRDPVCVFLFVRLLQCVRVGAPIGLCWWLSHLYGFSSQAQLEVSQDPVGARELLVPAPSLPALLPPFILPYLDSSSLQ